MNISRIPPPAAALLLLALLLASSCGRKPEKEILVYRTEKKPPAAPADAPEAAARPFTAELPPGWVERPAVGLRLAAYAVSNTAVEIHLVPLPTGNVPANVNRWREQLALPPLPADEIRRAGILLHVDGHETFYIALDNPRTGFGLLGAVIDLAPDYWYLTARGPSDELRRIAPDFLRFLRSFKIRPRKR